ncbi:phage head closure protein [Sporolactobacillus sp. CQH2019]|uniref:phage head closure protein n=1 Tax=Sporolactobacillus sp. CQH2019 TaxID=3023512 RepID=UPI0023689831|nr:phage head closure protein [Sporolactobacillus sp. CQH2019]MDD9149333.1 phage head closure protein [Sporolactobacillus sp. CQH2019]
MALASDPSRLNKRISFGTTVPKENGNGIAVNSADSNFQESFSLWCGIWNKSLAEKFAVAGTEHDSDITVIIRHNTAVYKSLLAQIDSVTYRVISDQPDESPSPVSFDLLTLRKVTK